MLVIKQKGSLYQMHLLNETEALGFADCKPVRGQYHYQPILYPTSGALR